MLISAACTEVSAPRLAPITDAAHGGLGPAAPAWQVTYLGTDWYDRARAWAVNDSNVVVGSVQLDAGSRSTTSFRATTSALQLLSLGAGRVSHVARGINRSGEIVGWFSAGGTFYDTAPWTSDTAFHLSPAGITTVLPPTHLGRTGAFDINDAGWIAGFEVGGGPWQSLWIRGHNGLYAVHELPGPIAEAVAVNTSGLVAGTSWTAGTGGVYGAMRMSLNDWDDLSNAGYCASDINDSNILVGIGPDSSIVTYQGFGVIPQGVKASSRECRGDAPRLSNTGRIAGTRSGQGAFTLRAGLLEALPLPAGANFSYANAINTCGTIAGSVSSRTTGKQRPVIWRRMEGGVQVCD